MNTTQSQIRRATTAAELEAIYRFRYRVYVEEMERSQFDADHRHKRIVDHLDGPHAVVLGAFTGHEVVGSVRSNLLSHGIGKYQDYYQIASEHLKQPSSCAITTRLMIDHRWRLGPLATRLAVAAYRIAIQRGVCWDYVDCNSHLLGFFTRLGYRQHRDNLVHPEYGHVHVLRLNLHDSAHLAEIQSPFVASGPIVPSTTSTHSTLGDLTHDQASCIP